MFTKLPLVAAAVLLLAACDADDAIEIFNSSNNLALVGTWVGVEEITNPPDIGSNVNFGDNNRGFSFPVTLRLHADGTFDLITANFATSFDNENLRTCVGTWIRNGASIQFFSLTACRALPLSLYAIGTSGGRSMNLEANTGTSLISTAASIRVRINLNSAPIITTVTID